MDLPSELSVLTDEQKWVAGSQFGLMRPDGESRLTFGTPSRIAPWAREALNGLVDRGIVSCEEQRGGLIYRPLISFRPLMAWAMARPDDEIGRRSILSDRGLPKSLTFSLGGGRKITFECEQQVEPAEPAT